MSPFSISVTFFKNNLNADLSDAKKHKPLTYSQRTSSVVHVMFFENSGSPVNFPNGFKGRDGVELPMDRGCHFKRHLLSTSRRDLKCHLKSLC